MSILVPLYMALGLGASALTGDPDGIVATARADAGAPVAPSQDVQAQSPSSTVSSAIENLSTADQIDRWLSARPATGEEPVWREGQPKAVPDDAPRRMTGEVRLGIGSHDYRDFGARVDVPLGENGSLSLGYSETRNAPYYRPVGRDGLFWDPRDPYGEWAGRGDWTTPSGWSHSPVDEGTLIPRRGRDVTDD